MKNDKKPSNTRALDKARVLELLATNAGANKRDLAKLLGLKGSDRIVLKRILKELEAEGSIAGRQKKGFVKRGELPEIGIVQVTGTDADGELLARPLVQRRTTHRLCHAAERWRSTRVLATGCWRAWNGVAKRMKPVSSAGWIRKPRHA